MRSTGVGYSPSAARGRRSSAGKRRKSGSTLTLASSLPPPLGAKGADVVLLPWEELAMRYPVDYVRHAAREIRKIEGQMRLGEADALSKEQLPDLLKTISKALDEIGNAIEALQRSYD
jgi:hypothetical protein